MWRCWNDINFPNQTQTSTCNLQLRNITFTSPREDLIDRTPPSLMDQNFAAMSVVWKMLDDIIMVSVLKFPPTIISPLLLLGREGIWLSVRPYPLCPFLSRIMHPHRRSIPTTNLERIWKWTPRPVHFSFQLIAQFWTRLEHGSSQFPKSALFGLGMQLYLTSACYLTIEIWWFYWGYLFHSLPYKNSVLGGKLPRLFYRKTAAEWWCTK